MSETRFIARDGFIVREIVGAYMLVPVDTGSVKIRTEDGNKALPDFNGMVQLDETGMMVWNALKEPKSVTELAGMICEQYEIDEETAKNDIMDFLDTGIRNQLIFILAE